MYDLYTKHYFFIQENSLHKFVLFRFHEKILQNLNQIKPYIF